MSKPTPENSGSGLCPSCSKPMERVRTIRRAFEASSEVLECRPCGVSITQGVANGKRQ